MSTCTKKSSPRTFRSSVLDELIIDTYLKYLFLILIRRKHCKNSEGRLMVTQSFQVRRQSRTGNDVRNSECRNRTRATRPVILRIRAEERLIFFRRTYSSETWSKAYSTVLVLATARSCACTSTVLLVLYKYGSRCPFLAWCQMYRYQRLRSTDEYLVL